MGVRYIESHIPAKLYGKLTVKVANAMSGNSTLTETELTNLIKQSEIEIKSAFGYTSEGSDIKFTVAICTDNEKQFKELVKVLSTEQFIKEFSITPVGD